jgi:hypothetical protein
MLTTPAGSVASPYFDVREVDTNIHKHLMRCLAAGDIEVIDLWEEGDGNQPIQLYRRPGIKVLRDLLADERLAGLQHFALKEYRNARGDCIHACDANDSLTFQLAQIDVGPGKVPVSIYRRDLYQAQYSNSTHLL